MIKVRVRVRVSVGVRPHEAVRGAAGSVMIAGGYKDGAAEVGGADLGARDGEHLGLGLGLGIKVASSQGRAVRGTAAKVTLRRRL